MINEVSEKVGRKLLGRLHYWAADDAVVIGPHVSEEDAYEAFCAAYGREPSHILCGKARGATIEGEVVWYNDTVDGDQED